MSKTSETSRTRKGPRFVLVRIGNEKWTWHLKPSAGASMAVSTRTYKRRRDALRGVRRACQAIMKLAAGRLDIEETDLRASRGKDDE